MTEASAETNYTNYLQGKRIHEEKMHLLESLKDTKAKIVVSGKNGQELLDFYSNTLTQIEQRWILKNLNEIQKKADLKKEMSF